MVRYFIMYIALMGIVACADDTGDKVHNGIQRVGRALFWPLTVISWMRSQNVRLHRLLTNLWVILIAGWFLSLLADRL